MKHRKDIELFSTSKSKYSGRNKARIDDESSFDEPESKSQSLKKDHRYAQSCIKITTTFLSPDYETPHITPYNGKALGSGSVIELPDQELGSKYYVLTNAHVAENGVKTYGKLADDFSKFELEPVVIGHDCDLALLKVKDSQYEKFKKITKPLPFGDMVDSGAKIQVNGFPLDFDTPELCSTTGKISRIKVSTYAQSGVELLQQQVEAAINPGNSGGPVIHKGRQVGVAFQGESGGEGLGFIIPMPVIKNFLAMALEVIQHPEREYRGFADIQFQCQEMESRFLRESYGMSEEQTGVLVAGVDPLSSAKDKLKVEDVILKIDGYPVSNEGIVFVRPSENIKEKPLHMQFLITRKLIGDSVHFTVLRNGKTLDIDVPLTNNSFTTKKIGPKEHKKFPTYYIASGLEFVPGTANLFDGLDNIIGAFNEYGGLSEIPKENPTDQIVLLREIFESDATEGYEFGMSPVKTINGTKINNMHDVVNAIESNSEPMHDIVINPGYHIRVPNMTPQEQYDQILSNYGITKYCSDDLRSGKFMDVDLEKKSIQPSLQNRTTGVPLMLSGGPQQAAKKKSALETYELSSDDDDYDISLSDQSDHLDEESSDYSDSESEGPELDEATRQQVRDAVRNMFPGLNRAGGKRSASQSNLGQNHMEPPIKRKRF